MCIAGLGSSSMCIASIIVRHGYLATRWDRGRLGEWAHAKRRVGVALGEWFGEWSALCGEWAKKTANIKQYYKNH